MRHIAILGAGPIGLEAALAARERGLAFTVYEQASGVGGHVRRWGHVRLFTPWSMNVSERMRSALGEQAPGGGSLPSGDELASALLEPLAALPGISEHVQTAVRVLGVAREGLLKHEEIASEERAGRRFRLLVRDSDGAERLEHADAVVDATGTYGNPNRLGDGGIDALGEAACEQSIERFLPTVAELAGRTVLLTGSGHSAQTAALELAELARCAPGTRVLWALRRPTPDFGAVANDPLPERARLSRAAGELAAGASPAVEVSPGLVTEAVAPAEGGRVRVTLRNGELREEEVDRVLALNGAQPDASLYRQLQVHECYASLGPMNLAAALLGAGAGGDCLAQESQGPDTLRNPEPGFFILGAKSYGCNSQFLMRLGWQQVDDVFGALL